MPKRTPAPKPGATEITNEWGIYDPDKAGMQALFKRLGRPILQASPKKTRNERRRAHRPERSAHGVGLAIEEARRRAGLVPHGDFEPISQSPARAMRAALRHQTPAAPAHFVPEAEPHPAPAHAPHHDGLAPAPPEPVHVARHTPEHATHHPAATIVPMPAPAPARRKRATKRAARNAAAESAPSAVDAVPADVETIAAPVPPVPPQTTVEFETTAAAAPVAQRPRARRAPRPRQAAAPLAAPAGVAPAPLPEPPKVKAGPPAPSPRRPRGPVPLAAWAHAAHDAPPQQPRRVDPLGFWRGWFRMPAEVALVEYARGARIHRLLIESIEDQPAELF